MSSVADTIEHHPESRFSQKAKADTPVSEAPLPAKARDASEVLVPARFDELEAVYRMVQDAIQDSPYYNDEFKAYESARLSPAYVAELWRTDPRHVITIRDKGALAGFMLSGPELGVLWQYWNYVDPNFRSGPLAMRALRTYLPIWENDRFHKIMTYSRPENKVSIALMERYRYQRVAELKEFIFGQDYLLYEYKLNKAKPGYDHGIGAGAFATLRYKLDRLLPFLVR
jgi:RimJ/RimL family protein N-acetyltransferase